MGTTTGNLLKVALPMTLILGVGTGGEYTSDYARIRDAKLVFGCHCSACEQGPIIIESTARDLEHARSILKLSTTELAEALGVSRQAIYNWKSGGQIKSQNVSKLRNLTAAADVIADADLSVSPLVINRILPGGKTLLEAITAGWDGAEAARSLLNLLRFESEERTRMNELLAGRRTISPSGEFDFGAPSFVEEG